MTAPEPLPAVVARLRALARDALEAAVPRGRPLLLVGTGIANVGDAAIAVATRRFLRARGGPYLEMDRRTWHAGAARRHLGDDGVLLLAGGGTFGDVWPPHDALRRAATAALRHLPVVQLPQTMRFRAPEALRAVGEELRAVPRLTLMLRDAEGVATARDHLGVPALLVPDLAFLLEPVAPPPERDVVALLRDDKEAARSRAERIAAPAPFPDAADWPPSPARGRRRLRRVLAATVRGVGGLGGLAPRRRRFIAALDDAELDERVATGFRRVGAGRVIVTDRLHGSILALLLGRRVVVLPDRHGKLRAFHATWTSACPDVRVCATSDEAQGVLAAWRAG